MIRGGSLGRRTLGITENHESNSSYSTPLALPALVPRCGTDELACKAGFSGNDAYQYYYADGMPGLCALSTIPVELATSSSGGKDPGR